MSPTLISRNPDLLRLQREGYAIEVRDNWLVMHSVPYVNHARELRQGVLGCALTLAGETTVSPGSHVISFSGDYPCNADGSPIEGLRHQSSPHSITGLTFHHTFSAKPPQGFPDYYEKFLSYLKIVGSPAARIDPNVTARTFPPIHTVDGESTFHYMDTATGRAGINAVSAKLQQEVLGIVGVGGTGAYILDFASKTPVKKILSFDGDKFFSHNAFRAPGAASLEELSTQPLKVAYFSNIYSKMHKGIVPISTSLNEGNLDQLDEVTFAFLCFDGPVKHAVVGRLIERKVPFIDVGMGLSLAGDSLRGTLRLTTATPEKHDHALGLIPGGTNADEENVYAQNIQIAELNALNAALAVIKWKKLRGFYVDDDQEMNSVYCLAGNRLMNSDHIHPEQ